MTRYFSKKNVPLRSADGSFAGGLHVFDTIDSTNAWSLDQISRGRELPFACIADHQSAGRGRRGKRWISPAGANIYMSLAWSFNCPVDELGLFPLAQGVAVTRALDRIGIGHAWMKWPNDVMIGENKIAGVLVETSGIRSGSCKVVAGVGLNYRMPDDVAFGPDVAWTDVARSIPGDLPEREALTSILLNEMVDMCGRYQGGVDAVVPEIAHRIAALKGKEVYLYLENGEYFAGTMLGITASGELRVQVNGSERLFNSADVSLRKRGDWKRADDVC